VERRYSSENDISAEETAKIKSSWISGKNENCCRQKSTGRKESKRKKSIIRLGFAEVNPIFNENSYEI